MASSFRYKPRFMDIRVRPPSEEEEAPKPSKSKRPEPEPKACDRAGCRQPAVSRAPKSRDMPMEHYWFCQAHAAEYNRNWNFFSGMSEGEIRQRMAEDQTTGGRPTWAFRAGPGSREAAATRGQFKDSTGMFTAEQAARGAAAPDSPDRRLGKLEREALADLDLDHDADGPKIRARYLDLVKRCHPDTNGGDRSAEVRLQRVIRAYKTLQKAKMV